MGKSLESKVELRRARSLPDFLFVRRLRNRVRLNMTGNTAPIGLWQQLRFWWRTPREIELYVVLVDARRAGYLLLREAGGTTLITEAIDEAFRGRGIAREVVGLAQAMRAELTADILEHNAASLRLHEACGFRRVSAANGIVTYRYR